MTLNIVGAVAALPGGATISNIQTINARASASLGTVGVNDLVNDATDDNDATPTVAFDVSGVAGLTAMNLTLGASASLKAAATTDVNVSGVTGGIEINGGKTVTVTDATANNNITVGSTVVAATDNTNTVGTAAAGAITVTDANQGSGVFQIDGGTSVDVTSTSTTSTGAIAVGVLKAASGAVTVTQNLNSDGIAALNGGIITTTGGTTVDINVNATSNAKAVDSDADITVGAITVNAGNSTTTVTINQNDSVTTFVKEAVVLVGATQTLKFGALGEGKTTIVGGLTFTAAKNLTAAEVAAAFANLVATDTQSEGGVVSNGEYTGSLVANWTSAAASGDTVVFTAAAHNTGAMTVTTGDVDPTSTYAVGTAAVAEDESENAVVFGAVVVNESATASVTTVTVNGYASADLGNTGTDLNALTTLSLTDSAGAATVATSATTLGLTVNNVKNDVNLDATLATIATLNLTATGKDSAFALTAAEVKTLAVSGDKAVSLTADLAKLETVTVSGSAGLTLAAAAADTIKSINTTGTTGAVSATIEGQRATYTGGAGKDTVTLVTNTSITKAISLGAGDDTLSFGALTVTGTTAALAGGDGTDTLAMNFASADALDATGTFKSFVTGFERLTINNVYDGGTANTEDTLTVDLANLGFTNYVTTSGTLIDVDPGQSDILVLDKMANNGTVVLTAEGYVTVNVTDAATGTADVLNVVLSSADALVAGTLTAANVETINITSTDTNKTAHSNDLVLVADKATTVNVSGNAALDLVLTSSTKVTLVDGSAMTAALTAQSVNLTSATTIKGGSGNDDLTANLSQDVLEGGAGKDTLTVADGANLVSLNGGAGKDTYVIGLASNANGYATINGTAAELSGDVIQFGAVAINDFAAAKIVLGSTAGFQDFANEATKGGATGNVSWFQWAGDTYVVQDNSANSSFDNGVDAIVKLVGTVNFTFNDAGATGTLEIA